MESAPNAVKLRVGSYQKYSFCLIQDQLGIFRRAMTFIFIGTDLNEGQP